MCPVSVLHHASNIFLPLEALRTSAVHVLRRQFSLCSIGLLTLSMTAWKRLKWLLDYFASWYSSVTLVFIYTKRYGGILTVTVIVTRTIISSVMTHYMGSGGRHRKQRLKKYHFRWLRKTDSSRHRRGDRKGSVADSWQPHTALLIRRFVGQSLRSVKTVTSFVLQTRAFLSSATKPGMHC